MIRRRIQVRVLRRGKFYCLIDMTNDPLTGVIRQRVDQLPALQDFEQLLRRCTAGEQPLQVELNIRIMDVALRKGPQDLLEHQGRG